MVKGLSLALALYQYQIPCMIYELRLSSVEATGALMLSPNALRILEFLGVYQRIQDKGYNFESLAFKNAKEETIDTYLMGSKERYDYKALRIYREVLLNELRAMVKERGIPIEYQKKFSHVISEDDRGVTFAFVDKSTKTSALLVGADGIHSTVRKYITPVIPRYAGFLAVTCAIPISKLNIDYPLPVAIYAKPGVFILAPQDVDGREVLAGTQFPYPEQDRAGWERLMAAKSELLRMLQKDMDDWPSTVQSALRNVPLETLSIWPFYIVPKLDSWTSPSERVLIIGDAAHAIPPTAGQGGSQAFEDSYTLAVLLSKTLADQKGKDKHDPGDALGRWQQSRQDRVDKVIALTMQLNNTRLPQAEREKLGPGAVWESGRDGDLAWLYTKRVEEDVLEWVGGGSVSL